MVRRGLDFTNAVITYDSLRIDMNVQGGSLILLVKPGTVVDADSLTVQHTDVTLGPCAEPGAPVILRVQLAGRICYGQIEARWRCTRAVTDAKSGAFSSPTG